MIEIKCITGDNSYFTLQDVSKHLHRTSVTHISTEYDLILTRAGVFEYDEEYISRTTVCLKHINKLQPKIIFHELKYL